MHAVEEQALPIPDVTRTHRMHCKLNKQRLLKLPGGGTVCDWLMLARLHLKCDDSDSAEDALQRATKALNTSSSTSSSSSRARASSSSSSSGKQVVGLGEEPVTADDIDCEKGWCALAAGQAQTANEQFMAVLTRTHEVQST
jgi:hypothetical protein